jgi:hypothetical protein
MVGAMVGDIVGAADFDGTGDIVGAADILGLADIVGVMVGMAVGVADMVGIGAGGAICRRRARSRPCVFPAASV